MLVPVPNCSQLNGAGYFRRPIRNPARFDQLLKAVPANVNNREHANPQSDDAKSGEI